MVCLVSYQSFSQIQKQYKEDPFPYDTGVSMELETYRLIRLKTINCDTLINVFKSAIKSDSNVIGYQDSIIVNQAKKINSLQETIVRKSSVIDTLNSNLNKSFEMLDSIEPEIGWHKHKETWVVAVITFLIGIVIK